VASLLINTGNGVPTAGQLKLGINRFGRHPENEFPIEHPTISAFHCEMILTATGVLLRDCASTNGTFLDDEPVKQASLRPGQTVRLGDVTILIETTDARIAIPGIDRLEDSPPVVLEDGTILCRRHPKSRASYRCTNCHELLCDACVHPMRRKGGKTLILCGLCSHATEPIAREARKKKSLLTRLKETMKLPSLRKRRTP
jgi:pSer/pThr/pTyr-binding forkhead associated (FHA) protein